MDLSFLAASCLLILRISPPYFCCSKLLPCLLDPIVASSLFLCLVTNLLCRDNIWVKYMEWLETFLVLQLSCGWLFTMPIFSPQSTSDHLKWVSYLSYIFHLSNCLRSICSSFYSRIFLSSLISFSSAYLLSVNFVSLKFIFRLAFKVELCQLRLSCVNV